jgi:hypothetical protein
MIIRAAVRAIIGFKKVKEEASKVAVDIISHNPISQSASRSMPSCDLVLGPSARAAISDDFDTIL